MWLEEAGSISSSNGLNMCYKLKKVLPLAKEALFFLLSLLRRQREFSVNDLKETHQRELHPLKVIKPCDNTGNQATGAPPTLKQGEW